MPVKKTVKKYKKRATSKKRGVSKRKAKSMTGGAKKKTKGKKRKAPDFFKTWNGFLNAIVKKSGSSRKDAMKVAKKWYAKHKGKMSTKDAMQKAWDEWTAKSK